MEAELRSLRSLLTVARNEINNLRQQIRSLNHVHEKEVDEVKRILQSWRCPGCKQKNIQDHEYGNTSGSSNSNQSQNLVGPETLELSPIGIINSWFPEKRGTPRQPGVSGSARGKLTIFNTVFTNPEHALEGLEEYSHMWIVFHFHKNDSTHVRAKVAPPRLNGGRMGVFATRSPHRPCPVGLSLVQIDKVEGNMIFFSGVDMVDGTPVLDIKPYIPQYDDPLDCQHPLLSDNMETRLITDGRESDDEDLSPGILSLDLTPRRDSLAPVARSPVRDALMMVSHSPVRDSSLMGLREAPDGEEGTSPILGRPLVSPALSPGPSSGNMRPQALVRVPAWIADPPVSRLEVKFNEGAVAQLTTIQSERGESVEEARIAIQSVLQEDPRSVYLRQRWNNQFYTFLIAGLHVSCRFADNGSVVTVFRITAANKNCECGLPEWQCTIHNGTS
ncbi:tRNA (adenine(37)-N6)-methyltransferase [Frankliniella occidentalis]|uniref:tRNA (Adenine(37)-N6)-methyltransferase n=2 Tax=Frankliniella occidentalis TaxID=133901 RepID=A0A9C6XD16_FRAOC|nr:tRNA (adenine(37)-N6)-methyltransferase [Frankliniella occidentalis]